MRNFIAAGLLGSVLMATSPCFGEPLGPIVKVRSYPCQRPQQALDGSGTLIAVKDKTYVLTSDHVVFPGRKDNPIKICNVVSNDLKNNLNADLVSLNFANGLAVLELSDGKRLGASAIKMESIRENEVEESEVTLSGVPYEENPSGEAKHKKASVVSFHSSRLMLPAIKNNAIAVRGHSEYGMSGGALWNEDGRFLGVISHRYLEEANLRPQQIPKAQAYRPGQKLPEGILAFVIPNAVVLPWLQTVFGDTPHDADLFPSLDATLRGNFEVNFNGVIFKRPTPGDGAGIGGARPQEDPAPEVTKPPIPLYLEMPGDGEVDWPFERGREWLKTVRKALVARKQVAVYGVEYQGTIRPVGDVMELFTYIERGYEPLVRITGAPNQTLSEVEKRIIKDAKAAQEAAASLRSKFVKPQSNEDVLLEEIHSQLEKVANEQFELVRDRALGELCEPEPGSPNALAWDALYNHESAGVLEKASKIRELLRNIRKSLPEVRL